MQMTTMDSSWVEMNYMEFRLSITIPRVRYQSFYCIECLEESVHDLQAVFNYVVDAVAHHEKHITKSGHSPAGHNCRVGIGRSESQIQTAYRT